MLLELFGAIAVVALVMTLFIRPGATVAIALAIGVVGAAIIVSWNDIQQTRAQRAANAAFQQQNSSAAATVPMPNYPRAGS